MTMGLAVAEPRRQASRPDTATEQAIQLLALAVQRVAERQRAQARALVAEAHALCAPSAAPATLATLHALEVQLAPHAGTPPIARLSRREREVLGLVARGLSNAEVADELNRSTRTVTTHLSSIFNKLGISSRTAAARIALEHGLV